MPFIPLEVFANNPSTTVASGGTSAPASGTVETWTVASSSLFPAVEIGAQQFHVADTTPGYASEMITVQNVTGTTWTVLRGAEGSGTVAHLAGFPVVQVTTAAVLAGFQYPPWQFPVQAYGAQGDGKIGTGGTGASGQAVLTDAGASFVNAAAPAGDVGKVIIVNQGTGSATVATNPFCGTIISVNSATSITLSGNLAATCTAAPYVYGTDDSAAINAAVAAAAAWAATTGNYKAQVIFEPQLYMLGTLTQTTAKSWAGNPEGPFTYNTHVMIPFTGGYQRKLVIDFIGVGDSSEPDYWGSTSPSVQGTCLVSGAWTASQPDGTFGQQSVIGTPSVGTNINTAGIPGTPFANVLVNVTGISVVTPYNTQQYSFDFRTAAQANIGSGSALAFAPVNYNSQTVGGTWLRSATVPSNTVAAGVAMPSIGNNDNCNVGIFSVEGIAIGMTCSEHINVERLATIYCGVGIQPVPSGTAHGGQISYWSCEGCNYGINCQSAGGIISLTIGLADFEATVTGYVLDAGPCLTGVMYWYDQGQWSPVAQGSAFVNAPHLKIVNLRHYPGPWAANSGINIPAPPAAPASGTASTNTQQNTAYRDATVYMSATTGITATFVGPASTGLTALGQVAGNGVIIPVRVPSGHWYSVTYTGTLTTSWILE